MRERMKIIYQVKIKRIDQMKTKIFRIKTILDFVKFVIGINAASKMGDEKSFLKLPSQIHDCR